MDLLFGIVFVVSVLQPVCAEGNIELLGYFPQSKTMSAGVNASLGCIFQGTPLPIINWKTSDSNFNFTSDFVRISTVSFNSSVQMSSLFLLQPLPPGNNFTVECFVNNSLHSAEGITFTLTRTTVVADQQTKSFEDILSEYWLVILGAGLGTILIIAALIIFCCKKYSRNKKDLFSVTYAVRRHNQFRRTSADDCAALDNGTFCDMSPDDLPKDTDIQAWHLEDYYTKGHQDNDKQFTSEFERLPYVAHCSEFPKESGGLFSNNSKNRYANILPYDYTRVKLQVQGKDRSSDYINASFVDGYYMDRKFICTQAPVNSTIGDFWRMVWEQDSRIIVMLVKQTEGNQIKSEEYWPPEDQSYIYGVMMVKFIDVMTKENYVKRTFLVSKTRENKEIRVVQYQYTHWPDNTKLPLTAGPFLEFFRAVKQAHTKLAQTNNFPLVVHCSGGIGRSGLFVAYDYLLDELNDKRRVNVFMTVVNMRRQRYGMVQNVTLYVYLFKLLMETHLFGDTTIDPLRLPVLIGAMARRTPDKQGTGYDEEFSKLDRVEPPDGNQILGSNHMGLNRNRKYLPYDRFVAQINAGGYGNLAPYYNASNVGKIGSHMMIAAQGPLSESEDLFWRLVIDNDVTTIVMVTRVLENGKGKCAQYWPGKDSRDYGNVKVHLVEESRHGDYDERMLSVSYKSNEARVVQMHFSSWSEQSPPESFEQLLNFVDKIHDRVATQGEAGLLVHCSDGTRRSGCMCVILQVTHRLRCGDNIDIFRAVKDMRDARPHIVETLEEYKLVYEIVGAYVERLKNRPTARLKSQNK